MSEASNCQGNLRLPEILRFTQDDVIGKGRSCRGARPCALTIHGARWWQFILSTMLKIQEELVTYFLNHTQNCIDDDLRVIVMNEMITVLDDDVGGVGG
jgi:hypothetical protein